MRFKVKSKTEDTAQEWDLSRKLYIDRKFYNVTLECQTPTGIAGTIELKYLSKLNAQHFEVGRDVNVDFSPAAPTGEVVDLPASAHPPEPEEEEIDEFESASK